MEYFWDLIWDLIGAIVVILLFASPFIVGGIMWYVGFSEFQCAVIVLLILNLLNGSGSGVSEDMFIDIHDKLDEINSKLEQ